MKVLFIGGPWDGKREHVGDNEYKLCVPTFDGTCGINVATHQYTIMKYRGANTAVALHSSISDPISALIKGYRRYRKPLSPQEIDVRRWQQKIRRMRHAPTHIGQRHGVHGFQLGPP